ncbi:TPA: hypothetical protein ACN35C_004644 [Vibrio parahaemolyticus]
MGNLKDLNEIRKILLSDPENKKTLGEVWTEDLIRDFGVYVTHFNIFLKSIRKHRQLKTVSNYWYEADFSMRSTVTDFLRSYQKLINIGEEPRSNTAEEAFERACRITEKYTETIELLAFIRSATDEMLVLIPFFNPILLDYNPFLKLSIQKLPPFKEKFDYLLREVDFFRESAMSVKPRREIKHNLNLSVVKSISKEEEMLGLLSERDFYFPELKEEK